MSRPVIQGTQIFRLVSKGMSVYFIKKKRQKRKKIDLIGNWNEFDVPQYHDFSKGYSKYPC